MTATALDGPGGPPRGIAVLRALQLGDLLCAVPALRAMRRAHPRAQITLIGLPWAADFARRFSHLVDAFVPFPGFPGLPERSCDIAAFPGFVAAAQQARYDAVIQLHGSGAVTNAIAALLGGAVLAGFHPAASAPPDPRRFLPWPESGTEAERCLALVEFLGMPRHGTALEFPVTSAERQGAAALLASRGVAPHGFVVVHAGARLRSRRWPAERFAALVRLLADDGWPVVLTGTPEEAAVCASVARDAGPGVVDLCGATSLGTLAALLELAPLVVCNDTGTSHVAAALGVPSVVVCCGADPHRFAPADAARHRVLFHPVPCRPCMHDACPIGHPCATGLALDDVVRVVFAQLRRYGPAAVAASARVPPAVERRRVHPVSP